MSDVNKEAPVIEAATYLPSEATNKEESSSTKPSEANSATASDAVKDAAASAINTASDKPTKIFGSFTDTPKKDQPSNESTPSKPLFGGFAAGTSSPWAAPTTAGGFGAASSFTPKKEEAEEKEEV